MWAKNASKSFLAKVSRTAAEWQDGTGKTADVPWMMEAMLIPAWISALSWAAPVVSFTIRQDATAHVMEPLAPSGGFQGGANKICGIRLSHPGNHGSHPSSGDDSWHSIDPWGILGVTDFPRLMWSENGGLPVNYHSCSPFLGHFEDGT